MKTKCTCNGYKYTGPTKKNCGVCWEQYTKSLKQDIDNLNTKLLAQKEENELRPKPDSYYRDALSPSEAAYVLAKALHVQELKIKMLESQLEESK